MQTPLPVARRCNIGIAALLGALVTAPIMIVFYLGHVVAMLPQPYYELFDKIARILPGAIITFAIDSMVGLFSRLPGVATAQASKASEAFIAILIFIFLGAVFGALTGLVYNCTKGRIAGAYVGFGLALIPAILTVWLVEGFNTGAAQGAVTTSATVFMVYLVGGIVLGVLIEAYALRSPRRVTAASPSTVAQADLSTPTQSRRTFLVQAGGGAVVLTALGYGVGRLLDGQAGSTGGAMVATNGSAMPTMTPMPANMPADAFMAVPGTRLENTPNDQFYRVDVNITPPRVDPTTWRLLVDGEVQSSYTLTYDELLKLPATEQDATLECISNPVGGDLISTTHWKGVTLKSLLEKAKLSPNVKEIKFTCSDGYTESLPLASAMDGRTLMAYATNDEPLRAEHGFPLRLYVPNRFGMKNPKWVTQITAINDEHNGYWEVRGWNKDAFVKSTSIFDTIAVTLEKDGVIPVGGIAFAGDRTISKVELSVDDGPWQPAQLKAPISPLCWSLWRFDWKATKGYHTLTVRCTDGKGALQIDKPAPLHPDGASGYVTKTQTV